MRFGLPRPEITPCLMNRVRVPGFRQNPHEIGQSVREANEAVICPSFADLPKQVQGAVLFRVLAETP
jgi:hypothetical protein